MPSKTLKVATAAGTALSNSTTEAVLDSYVLPAYAIKPGKIYRVRASVRATATNSTDTLRVRLRIGHTTLTGTVVADGTAVDVANDDVIVIALDITPRSSAGVFSGVVVAAGHATLEGAAGTVTARAAHVIVSSLLESSDLRFEITGAWSNASSSNSCQVESFSVEEICD